MALSRFDLTEAERSIPAAPLDAELFRVALTQVRASRVDHFVRAYTRDRVPAAFSPRPLLWEAMRAWLAGKISARHSFQVLPSEVGLTGSATLGFSPVHYKFGKSFGEHSDLDLMVVNSELFELVQLDVARFLQEESPQFVEQRNTLRNQLPRGFADTKNVPARRQEFPTTSDLLNDCWLLREKLGLEGMRTKRSSIRIYASWHCLAVQLETTFRKLRSDLSKTA